MKETVKDIITRYGHRYKRQGSFSDKGRAKRYANKLSTAKVRALVLHIEDPKQMGYKVDWHVYQRIGQY